jgi:hypothetical protein
MGSSVRRVGADAPGDERLDRRQVVDHEGDLAVAGSDVADLARAQHRLARPAHPHGRALDLEGDRGDIGLAVRGDGGQAGQRLGSEVLEFLVGEGHAHHCCAPARMAEG